MAKQCNTLLGPHRAVNNCFKYIRKDSVALPPPSKQVTSSARSVQDASMWPNSVTSY